MSAAVNIEELKKLFLECTICHELFNDTNHEPRVLPCLHSYCCTCLKKLIEQSHYECSLCKLNFYVENVSVDSFPKDNTRRDLLDFVRASDHKSVILCETCEIKKKAISRCKDCSSFICDSCNTAHENMKIFRDHEVFALEDGELSMDNVCGYKHAGMCSIHEDEKLTVFCDGSQCQMPMCYICCLTNHMPTDSQKHNTRSIKEVYDEKRRTIGEKKDKMLKTEIELVKLSKRIDEQKDRFVVNADTTKADIQNKFEEAVEILECRRDLLIEKTENLRKEKTHLLDKQVTEVNHSIGIIRDACRFFDQAVATENQSAFLLLAKTISDRFKHLNDNNFDTQPRDSNVISFSKSNFRDELTQFVNKIGKISSWSAFGPNTKVTFPTEIEPEEVFDIFIEFFDYDKSPALDLDEMKIKCMLFETADAPLDSIGELSFDPIENGKYKASCKIMDTSIQRINLVRVMMNGRDFYVVELNPLIKIKPKEVQTNGN